MKLQIITAGMLLPMATACSGSEGASQAQTQPEQTQPTPALPTQTQPPQTDDEAVTTGWMPDVVYVPTPPQVVDAMLEMAKVKDGDVLYDLGSGDGRIPIAAATKYKLRAVGIDIDPQRIAEANANAKEAGVADEVTFRHEDLFKADFSDATVVTLYLLDSLNQKLRPRLLKELKPGTRIVSHAFTMGDWMPEQSRDVEGSMIYLWTVPDGGQAR